MIRLFGPLEVSLHGRPLPPLRSQRGKWLLALLALRPGREVERMWLAGMLWPDSTDAQALATLRRTLTDLRRVLGAEARRISSPSRHTLRFDLTHASVDAIEFDQALQQGDLASLERAVSLYRAPLLEGCVEEWVIQDREIREQAYLDALEKLADLAAERKEFSRAADYLRLAISVDPLRECAQRSLMKALSACGDHSAAVQVYRDLRVYLRDQLNTEPDPETRSLYERNRAQAKAHATEGGSPVLQAPGPAPALPGPSGNVPHPLTSLVGREQELRQIGSRLNEARLVTLTGPGGVGKTRLAIQVAREVAEAFDDGVAFVALAPVADPNLVSQTMASILGIREEPGQPLVDTLSRRLQAQRLLVVLDNCEHLIDSCAHLVDALLSRCPQVKVLATSRQSLGVTGEVDWRVPPLSLPLPTDPDTDPEHVLHQAAESGAVRLFAERAAATRANFALDRHTAPRVAAICRRLDGIPLAIELAAARAKLLSVAEIESRLDDSFQLLTGGSRTALPRQQTLQAAMDWSYDLLETAERVLLRRVSVFAGSFGLEAVRAVCCDPRVPESAAEPLLGSLVDKSLVTPVNQDGESRYRLLEITREYAARLLREAGEADAVQRRHAEHFLSVVERAEEEWNRAPAVALQCIDAIESDLRAVRDWCVHSPEGRLSANRVLRMSRMLAVHCDHRGRASEGRRWLENLLRVLPERTEYRANALLRSSGIATSQEDYAAARAAADEARSIFEEIGDRAGIARALRTLALALYSGGEASASVPLLEESLQIFRDLGDMSSQTGTINHLGIACYALGDYARSRAYHEQCLALVSARGSEVGKAWSQDNLGDVALAEGDLEQARTLYRRSLPIFAATRILPGITECLRGLAQAAVARGGQAGAHRAALLFGAVDSLRSGLDPISPLFRKAYQEAVEQTRRLLGDEGFAATWNDGRKLAMEAAIALALQPEED